MHPKTRLTATCSPRSEAHRLAAGLALSLACHALLLNLNQQPLTPLPTSINPPVLAITWRPASAETQVRTTPHKTTGVTLLTTSQQAQPAQARKPAPELARDRAMPHGTTGNTVSSQPDATLMLNKARQEIATESRRQVLDPMFAPPPVAAPLANPGSLTRALAPGTQRIEQLADGMVRVTTGSGRQYCLQVIPEVVSRGLLHTPTRVPTNCP